MTKITLEEKRKLSKILGENIVEEDDATAIEKLTELFKSCVTAEMAFKVVEQLPEDEQTKLREMMQPQNNDEVVEPADNTNDNIDTEEVAEDNQESELDAEVADVPVEEPTEEPVAEPVADEEVADTDAKEETVESVEEPSEDIDNEVAEEPVNNETDNNADYNDELFDAKLEAALLRANVREDRIESAKKLFKADHTIDDIGKINNFVKEYPEWTKQKTKEQPKPFGMEVGGNDYSETAEEKRLKELGYI